MLIARWRNTHESRFITTSLLVWAANPPVHRDQSATRSVLILALVTGTAAFLFPGAGGGGGCGCGCEDTSCLPKPPRLTCQRVCFSIPSLSIPSPCGGGGGCGCGGRKKRAVAGDAQCTDPELRKLILAGIRNDVTESRNNIVAGLKEKHGDTRYLVTCVQGTAAFQSSADEFCSDGTPQLTCQVVRAVDPEPSS
ncbi:ground-like domain protein [Ancylostoma caninum]|uniref:Ground-like domain protein n=1 Tax=Ancylostoma caninum TaxID=29170 RepID=A0A368GPT7_ANCCA|nr:ground-like domain protein [Ancylostoma caninum]